MSRYERPTRLADIRTEKGLTQAEVGRMMKTTGVTIGRYEKEPGRLTLPLLRELATVLKTSVAEIIDEAGPADLVFVNELNLGAVAGRGGSMIEMTKRNESEFSVASYGFPKEAFRQIYGVSPDGVHVAEVVGDSMMPTLIPGQKVVLNSRDQVPSPPGIFVLFDGLGMVMKRVEYIAHSDPPRVRISSDNKAYEAYERLLDEAFIQARIIGKWDRT